MNKDRLDMLKRVMELEFTAIDLNLFLDTHPNDQKALAYYDKILMELRETKREYEKRYGPLTVFGVTPGKNYWQWVEEPWPWEIQY